VFQDQKTITTVSDELFEETDVSLHQLTSVLGSVMTRKIDYADIYFQRIHEESWCIEENKVKDASTSFEQGFGLRVVSDDKTGFAYADDISYSALTDAARTAGSIVSASASVPVLSSKPVTSRILYPATNPLAGMNDSEKVSFLHEMNAYARSLDSRIEEVSVRLSSRYETVLVSDGYGALSADIRPLIVVQVQVMAVEGKRREQGSGGGGGRADFYALFGQGEGLKLVDKAARQAILNLSAEPAPAGQMPVVLGPGWPGVLLHEAVGHGLEGDCNRKGSSVFCDKMGKKVASDLCTVVDDGTIPGRRGSLSMDDEGVETKRTLLIENGILVGYMQDRHNARLMSMELTGNGRRESYAHLPLPRMTNTFLLAGKSDPENIIASVDRGIYAVDFAGGQVDTTSGKFVFSMSEAYLIENGKIGAPLKGATLIGHGPDILHEVSMVGHDLQLDSGIGTCGKAGQTVPVGVGQPTLRIDKMTVGGSKIE
jgi:TldD protein